MDTVEKSNATLRRIEQNDPKFKSLHIVGRDNTAGHTSDTCFWPHDSCRCVRLGNAIANNTHLEGIVFHNCSEWTLDIKSLFEGLQQSTTIRFLTLHGGIGIRVLNEFVANSSSITDLSIETCDLRDGVSRALSQTITKCPNLKGITMFNCKIDDAGLNQFASGIIGISSLERLRILHANAVVNGNNYTGNIDGTEGAKAILALFQDPNCNLTDLDLASCGFSNDSIQIVVNSLMGNTKLATLNLSFNKIEISGFEAITGLLQGPSCNLTKLDLRNCGINNECILKIVTSLTDNTKLENLTLSSNRIGRSGCESIAALLQNPNSNIKKVELASCKIDEGCTALLAQALTGNNKLKCLDLARNPSITEIGWNAFSAILSNCSNHTLLDVGDEDDIENMPVNLPSLLKLNLAVDMEPLFELDTEDERKPKALPCVVDWFDRCIRESNQNEEVVMCINARKLSAIYQFARAMPLKFVPSLYQTRCRLAR